MKKQYLRKLTAGFLIWFLAAAFAVGCGRQSETLPAASDGRLKIVCTIFPEYDWVKQILGEQTEDTELTLLLKNGSDLHSYQPTVWDMVNISEADLFIYVGGESDFWVEDALANAKNPDIKTLNLMEILKEHVKEEEHVEGMQEARGNDHEEESHDHAAEAEGHAESEADGQEAEYDEHIWLSLRNAGIVCESIKDALCELDKEHRDVYEQNFTDYAGKLQALDAEYAEVTERALSPVLLFGDRFPFRYLTEDYGLSYYAAFAGCSAETEASFETITFLANKADELHLPAILTIDGSDQKIARTIARNTKTGDQEVWMLDSMQSVGEQDIENGENYLSIMERNLEVLKKALPGTQEDR